MKKGLFSLIALVLSVTVAVSPVLAATQAWEVPLEHKMAWSSVTYFGTLLVGYKKGLASFNPETGEQLWSRDDVSNLAPYDVVEVVGYPILILANDKGLGGSKSEVEAVNMATGETIWKTDKIGGAPLGVYSVPDKSQILFFANIYYEKDKEPGITIFSYEAQTGELLWDKHYCRSKDIPLYMADNSGTFSVRLDFSGYHDPVFDGDVAYLSFKGLDAINVQTGEILWEAPFKVGNKNLKKAYAAPILHGDVVYASGQGTVYAINESNGTGLWQTEKVRSGLISQLVVTDEMVLARIGGNFLDQGQKKFVPDKPFGVFSYNTKDGVLLWEFKGAKGGITNFIYLKEFNTVMLADATSLIGLDTQSTGEIKETFRLPLKFKRKVGSADIASAGVKTLTGGLGGLLNAGAKMAIGKERQDPPVSVVMAADGTVVVRGEQHILSFDPKAQDIKWSLSYNAPGQSGLGIAMVTGVSAFAALGYSASYASGGATYSSASSNIKSQFQRMDHFLDKRFSKTKSSDEYAYIMANVDDGSDSGMGVMAINLITGETDDQFLFNEKNPEYNIDQIGGRLYFFPKKKSIAAYELKQ